MLTLLPGYRKRDTIRKRQCIAQSKVKNRIILPIISPDLVALMASNKKKNSGFTHEERSYLIL